MDNRRIWGLISVFLLLCALLFVWGCAGIMYDRKATENAMFPGYSKEEVMQACIAWFVETGFEITLYDAKAGLIQAGVALKSTGDQILEGRGRVGQWGVQVLEGNGGVNLNVHLDFRRGFSIYGGASRDIAYFIREIRKQLKEEKK